MVVNNMIGMKTYVFVRDGMEIEASLIAPGDLSEFEKYVKCKDLDYLVGRSEKLFDLTVLLSRVRSLLEDGFSVSALCLINEDINNKDGE